MCILCFTPSFFLSHSLNSFSSTFHVLSLKQGHTILSKTACVFFSFYTILNSLFLFFWPCFIMLFYNSHLFLSINLTHFWPFVLSLSLFLYLSLRLCLSVSLSFLIFLIILSRFLSPNSLLLSLSLSVDFDRLLSFTIDCSKYLLPPPFPAHS